MWMILGGIAVLALVINLALYALNKNSDLFRYISLSCTALVVCDFYNQNRVWVVNEDWGALMDVVPLTSVMLWGLVIVSIIANGISLIKRSK